MKFDECIFVCLFVWWMELRKIDNLELKKNPCKSELTKNIEIQTHWFRKCVTKIAMLVFLELSEINKLEFKILDQ